MKTFLATVGTPATDGVDNSDLKAVLQRVYSAVVQGDFDTFAESLADDVALKICGFGPMDGGWQGRREVVAATRKNFAMVEGQKPTIESMISQGDCVAVLFREDGVLKSTGRNYNIRCVQWFTFADGKIKKIDEIVASALDG